MKLTKFFLPTIVGISLYIIINKFFPENLSNKNSEKDLRGGDLIIKSHVQKLLAKIMYERALKVAIIGVFVTAGAQHFHEEIQALLIDQTFQKICVTSKTGQLNIVCDIVKEHELIAHTKSINKLIIANNLSREDKINLLKIKLDFIINGECSGKTMYLTLAIIGALMTLFTSGLIGLTSLTLFLEAVYRLFQEGKISRALYEEITKLITKRWFKVPIEHLN